MPIFCVSLQLLKFGDFRALKFPYWLICRRLSGHDVHKMKWKKYIKKDTFLEINIFQIQVIQH
jgi:hypothetical protein